MGFFTSLNAETDFETFSGSMKYLFHFLSRKTYILFDLGQFL